MSVIDVLRPTSVRVAAASTAVPSGTLASVSSDNSDATYINTPTTGSTDWVLQVEAHTPAAGYQRHQARVRTRTNTNAGTASQNVGMSKDLASPLTQSTILATSVITDGATAWFQGHTNLALDTVGTLSGLNAVGSPMNFEVGATALHIAEVYVDIDTRLEPQYSPEIRDAVGVDQAGSVVTNTTTPDLYFGTVGRDDLPALAWSVSLAGTGGVVFTSDGTGEPPEFVTVDPGLADGSYTATFFVSSTIRGSDEFGVTEVLSFAVANEVPPPSPPLLSAVREGDGYRVTWSNPGGQVWDDDYTVAEVWRDDCTGSARIATVPDGLEGSYLDLAIPQIDSEHVMVDGVCTAHEETCDITYRVRYWGYISVTVEIPDSIPVQLILAWPSTAASIPSGWLRVTDYDGVYPRGTSGTGAPSATGGSTSHSHTSPSHSHSIPAHQHVMPSATDSSNASTTTDRFNGATYATANQSHTHTLPLASGNSSAVNTGSTAPGTNTANNVPPTRDVIWIRSDGSAVQYPVGALGWSLEVPSGWTADATSSGRFLKGAVAAGNGGATSGTSTHTHSIASHTHSGTVHDHPNFTTGLSGPAASTEANAGSGTPRWLPRHTHNGNVIAATGGTIPSASGGTTGSGTLEPLHRRLKVLRNTGGGAQTRIIGLYNGTVAALDPILTLCNGSNGTPDMRGWFARDTGSDSANSTGGAATHTHSTPTHSHGVLAHIHAVEVAASVNTDRGRDTSGDLGNVPTESHTHDVDNTQQALPTIGSSGSGTTGSGDHTPPYKEAHFVRLDGIVEGDPLAVPELKVSDFASVTVEAIVFGTEYDRLSNLDGDVMSVPTSRSSNFPRLVTDSTPLDGGLHTVSSTLAGEDLSLVIATESKADIDALETLLSADRVYWAPLGGTPGWFAPAGWSVDGPAPNVKVLSITMVRQSWPATDDPEDFV
jgi:hypothetical protein